MPAKDEWDSTEEWYNSRYHGLLNIEQYPTGPPRGQLNTYPMYPVRPGQMDPYHQSPYGHNPFAPMPPPPPMGGSAHPHLTISDDQSTGSNQDMRNLMALRGGAGRGYRGLNPPPPPPPPPSQMPPPPPPPPPVSQALAVG
ncbi:hypothetical protein P154DRAFT_523743 [Amniculicola lignicola CBS 123094]|uniref:Uncharacterized protein n=1 Tax=Amniculicola lignicola CBS 123094 TaxID=1392246 RepID=A0A6A5WCP8_9PLEO|nr:hypothetical protein P154DRAFT_523743 [Amniculicola lignicola CBS 123094]